MTISQVLLQIAIPISPHNLIPKKLKIYKFYKKMNIYQSNTQHLI